MGKDATNVPEYGEDGQRMSEGDGYTIVVRKGRRPRIHMLPAWPECNTTKRASGEDTVRVEGGRENLMLKLFEMGYRNGGVACRRCFRYHESDDVETPVMQLGDADVYAGLDKYDEEVRVGEPVLVEL